VFQNSTELPSNRAPVELPASRTHFELPSHRDFNDPFPPVEAANGRYEPIPPVPSHELGVHVSETEFSNATLGNRFLPDLRDSGAEYMGLKQTISSDVSNQSMATTNTPPDTQYLSHYTMNTRDTSPVNKVISRSSQKLMHLQDRRKNAGSTFLRRSDRMTASEYAVQNGNQNQKSTTTPSQRYLTSQKSPLQRLEAQIAVHKSTESFRGEISDEDTVLSEMRSMESLSQLGGGSVIEL
jgi:hypothetical protein